MKRIILLSLTFLLLLSACGNFTEEQKSILENKPEDISDQFFLDMAECFLESMNIAEYKTVEPYYTDARKITKKYTDNLKKLNDKEKEILQVMISLLESDKKYIENNFNSVYLEESSKYILKINELMLNNEE